MTGRGILASGSYVPISRLERAAIHQANHWFAPGLAGLATGERAVAGWDEDSVTMAVEAARNCLSGVSALPDRLTFASGSPPWADRLNAGIIHAALDLPANVASADLTSTGRAATTALKLALDGMGTTLVAAADRRRPRPASEAELVAGDAAAALLVGEGELVANYLGGHSTTVDFIDHFRETGAAHDYGWEARWVRDEGFARLTADTLVAALDRLGVDPASIAHVIAPPGRGVAELLVRKAGIQGATICNSLVATVGDCGATHPLLQLVHVLEDATPGARILLVGFGQGVDVLLFEATGLGSRSRMLLSDWLARRRTETNYARYLVLSGHLELERGMRAEVEVKPSLSALWRNRRAVMGLVGGRCRTTGTVQYPASAIMMNHNGPAVGPQEPWRLADIPARIVSFTADRLAYHPDPPLVYGMIDFEGGGRMMAEFADADVDSLKPGLRMRMMFRVKARDDRRGFSHYFWKAVPDMQGEG